MSSLLTSLTGTLDDLAVKPTPEMSGKVLRYDGLILECTGFPASPGAICEVETEDGSRVQGEIVGFRDGRNMLFLDTPGARIVSGARVRRLDGGHDALMGEALLGRVIDAEGHALDDGPNPQGDIRWPLAGKVQNPLARQPVDQVLDVGVRIINSALTVGRGQRVGIIAGSGVGKSVLIEMMTKNTNADVVVVGLVGERAREVGAFVGHIMHGENAHKTCVVAVPADRSPLLRLRAANRATAIAEYFRSKGKDVLLIMDSLTRCAHARREIGLALGEQPTAKGYTPSVVSMIPTLIERAGPGLKGEGSITAFYTILADGDDTNDPVVDTARAILDGHLVLSRKQAQMGIYPAIDIPQSVSRVMNDIVDKDHQRGALKLRRMISLYMDNRDMMLMGAYTPGQDPELDEAVQTWPRIKTLIQQPVDEKSNFVDSRKSLLNLAGGARMTRKEKLMDLMVRKEKAKLGQESKELGQIAQQAARAEAQSNQLKNLLDESVSQRPAIQSKAQLASTMWFGNAIAQQLTNVEVQREQSAARLAEARGRVAQAEQRVRIYGEKAVETRREARAEADAKEDSRLGERGRSPR